jgi:cyclic dehypoxanthinyl futalosine synthase
MSGEITSIRTIEDKINTRTRITREDARFLFESATNDELKKLSTMVKSRLHPTDKATYLKMAIVNYTNVCVAMCDYCSFYRLPHQSGTYLLSTDEVCKKIDELVAFGGTEVGFNGGFHPKLKIDDYANLFKEIHVRYPDLGFKEMTVAEFMFACKNSKLSYDEGAQKLRNVGTHWITGGGAEILTDSFRDRHSPGKYKVEDYYSAQKAILDAGMGSTATMVIGFDETLDERLEHLDRLRRFQDETNNGLTSFLCWSYKPYGNKLGGQEIETIEYLRWLAVSRIFLDNMKHIRTSVLTKNEKALDGLLFGADDFDLPTEDEVTQKAGATVSHEFEKVLNYAAELGIEPVYRKPFSISR